MRYRVRFTFAGSHQPYYSEWFATVSEALGFDRDVMESGGTVEGYENEDGDEF